MIGLMVAITALCEPRPGARAMFARTDSATVTVCLAARHRVTSYHAVVTWDSTAASVERIDHTRRGMFAENVQVQGRVDFAGSDRAGFDSGAVLRIRLRARDGRPAVRLTIIEMSAAGQYLIAPRGPWPHIASITPDTLALGSTAKVTIRGQRFAPDSNRLAVGPVGLEAVPSSAHGTEIRFVMPASLISSGEAPPIRIGPATYAVRVTTRSGSSNVVPFTLVERVP